MRPAVTGALVEADLGDRAGLRCAELHSDLNPAVVWIGGDRRSGVLGQMVQGRRRLPPRW